MIKGTTLSRIKHLLVNQKTTVCKALEKMDQVERKLLIVTDDENNYVNVISIGDIQRSLINNQDFQRQISETLRSDSMVADSSMTREEIKHLMLQHRTEFMPILEEGCMVDILFWEDLYDNEKIPNKRKYDIPVVIMAGGKGTRLRPFTNVIPKPLIPIGEKAIVELIVNRFVDLGSKRFFFSINYLGEMVENYFNRISSKPYSIDFFTEDEPLGTAGSLYLMKDNLKETFVVSNCDILVEQDYSEIIRFHRENNFKITMVAAVKNYGIPYGTLEVGKGGELLGLNEKPQFNYFINTGLYIIEPEALDEIPANSFFHITNLIEQLRLKGEKVGVFPINGGSWSDIGEWDVYQETLKRHGQRMF